MSRKTFRRKPVSLAAYATIELMAQKQIRMAEDEAPNSQAPRKAAGIAFVAPDGRTLFLRRGAEGDHSGEWCFPGGGIDSGEMAEQAAMREAMEEVGALPYGERDLLHAGVNDEGVHYTTFRQHIVHAFRPRLNDESTEFAWAMPGTPPEPLHPAMAPVLALLGRSEKVAQDLVMAEDKGILPRGPERLAFDKGTVRSIDQDGRLRVSITNISKATVNPYRGSEIPDSEELGLEPDRIYYLLRDPEELEKATATFNGIPLLNKHIPVSVEEPQKEFWVGTTGTECVFEAPYLKNSLVVWEAAAIAGIDTEEAREISCAYRYVADMTPGNYEGTPYDGVMRQLKGNHVALVGTGRAGPDVIVGDGALDPTAKAGVFQTERKTEMSKKQPLSARAVLAKGALLGLSKPFLAADAKLDLNAILAEVTSKNWLDKKPGIIAAIKPKMAADADPAMLVRMLDTLDGEEDGEINAIDADPCGEMLDMLRGKVDDATLAAVEAKMRAAMAPPAAMDTPPPTPGTPPPPGGAAAAPAGPPAPVPAPKPAMDAASVSRIVDAATAKVRNDAREASEAREVVRPYVGGVSMALDTGEAVYKAALDLLKVDATGVHPSAYKAVLMAQPKPGQRQAHDAAVVLPSPDLVQKFAGLGEIRHA